MADLRDTIHASKDDLDAMDDNTLFMAYHVASTHYAIQRIAAGLRLTPEARKYMRDDLARRRRLEEQYKLEIEKEKALADGESTLKQTAQSATSPAVQREPGADAVPGNGRPDPQNG
jgi:hypothetical protein